MDARAGTRDALSGRFVVLALDLVAEQRIAEAIANGEFDNLPGGGRPLALDDDRMVPDERRAAYRILRNAGCVPPEVDARREHAALSRLLLSATGDERKRALVKMALIREALAVTCRASAAAR